MIGDGPAVAERPPRQSTFVAACLVLVLVAGCASSIRTFALSTFTSADGRFHIDVPGGVMADRLMPGAGAFARSTVHALTSEGDGLRFAVLYGDADPSYLATTGIDAALKIAERDNVASTNGVQTSDRAITIDDQPAVEQRITSDTTTYRFHLVFVGDRLYSIAVTGSEGDVLSSEATTYLGSFTVLP